MGQNTILRLNLRPIDRMHRSDDRWQLLAEGHSLHSSLVEVINSRTPSNEFQCPFGVGQCHSRLVRAPSRSLWRMDSRVQSSLVIYFPSDRALEWPIIIALSSLTPWMKQCACCPLVGQPTKLREPHWPIGLELFRRREKCDGLESTEKNVV